ncbi:TetR/AcrR family transcriptional regulator [Caulobacter ginsengisoli]|uniref:TetR/AcrR family transcriptional regulator n=1 Tax=Caulobacter ginsengisoli TaxID=400775 RepID=UPI0027D8C26A|nr:TetR/AcrR family transcriptional regulator [Caulobacter ginsengisoli]
MGVRESQKQETRRKVLDAARDLFNEIGFDETTIRAVAERAGVSVGSVFTTFSSKAHLLSQVMEDRVDLLFHELQRVVPHLRGSTADRLCSIFAIHYEFETRRDKLFLAHVAAAFSPNLEEGVIPYGQNARFRGMILETLQSGVSRGDVCNSIDLDLALTSLMAAYGWNYRLAAQRRATAQEMSDLMDRQILLLFNGLKPR